MILDRWLRSHGRQIVSQSVEECVNMDEIVEVLQASILIDHYAKVVNEDINCRL